MSMELEIIYLDKAQESLEGAESEFVNRRYNNCANRVYYACSHAAIYALVQSGIKTRAGGNWGHDFVQAQFNGELINRRKIFPADLRSVLRDTYILRETADYKSERVSEVRSGRMLRRTTNFVEAIRLGGDAR